MYPKGQEPQQLSLGISLRDEATFANFWCAPDNAAVVHGLTELSSAGAGEQNVLIWGPPEVGLSHMLQACCHKASKQKLSFQYLPLRELHAHPPQVVCDGLEECQLVCIDDLHCIVESEAWQRVIFHLFNRVKDNHHRLVFASHKSPLNLNLGLADLRSRVLGSVVYQVHRLSDTEKCAALAARAHGRGMELSDDVARYILSRVSRNPTRLFQLLDVLDEASLRQQRKLTIPFVKSLLGL